MHGGDLLLRIEDIDTSRCKPAFEAAILDDLAWLGLRWPLPVMRQSERMPAYRAALDRLVRMGLCYPCACTRREIRAALSAPQEKSDSVDYHALYPGTCRGRSMYSAGPSDAIRLDMAAALSRLGTSQPLGFAETGPEQPGWHVIGADELLHQHGDIVLARRDIGTSYHLAVVVDDAAQGITEVVRGQDLFDATALHVLLQALLGLARPVYHHHRLIRDAQGRRLAKRDADRALRAYRAAGATPAEIRCLTGLAPSAA